MSDSNKTEQPTEKRLEKAREEGNFRFSEVVVQLASVFAATAMCYFALYDLPERFDRALSAALHLGHASYFKGAVENFVIILLKETLPPAAMVFGASALFAIVSNIAQVGFVFQGAKFTKGLQAMNPVTNAKNLFSKQTLSNLFLSIVKVLVICGVAYNILSDDKAIVDRIYAHRLDAIGGLAEMGQMIWHVSSIALLSLIPIAVLDFGLKHVFYIKDNMMGKDEVQREHKENNGSPEVKSERKAIAHQLLDGPPDRLKGASAVIRNPTHIAVVVRYEPNVAPVPYISDMQEGFKAKEIIRKAIEMGVPLYEDIPFARALYAKGEVNVHMPLELSEKIVPFTYWLMNNHPDRVYDQPEFAGVLTEVGNVKR